MATDVSYSYRAGYLRGLQDGIELTQHWAGQLSKEELEKIMAEAISRLNEQCSASSDK